MKLPAPHDRPREKLARSGVGALGDNELVALLLGTGVKARSALEVAQDVLDLSGGVRGLTQVGIDDLLRVSGVGRPRAARLLAAVELGRRAISHVAGERVRFGGPSDIGRYLLPLHGGYREERFGIVMLDSKLRLIRSETLSIGILDASIAHPREVFRTAMLASASCIALFHNHPSGDPTPSHEDVLITTRLVAAGDLMGINVVDHVILGAGRWYSFHDAGMLQ
ncbi:MAG TPA: DNA repair protein RadC [Vicinamibacterales bacterium]|nr:DNA repair protein RadC [Vicinamibacterales bacterium]